MIQGLGLQGSYYPWFGIWGNLGFGVHGLVAQDFEGTDVLKNLQNPHIPTHTILQHTSQGLGNWKPCTISSLDRADDIFEGVRG